MYTHTLVRTLIALIASNLDYRGLAPLLLTHKPIYFVSIIPKNNFSVFNLNTSSVNLCRNFSNTFRCPLKSFLVINNTPSMYSRTRSNPLNSSDIFSWKIWGLLQTPIRNFWYSYLPHISTIVKSCLDPGDNYM